MINKSIKTSMPQQTFYSHLSLCHPRSNFGLCKSVVGSNSHSTNWAKKIWNTVLNLQYIWIPTIQISVCPWHHTILETNAFSFHCCSLCVTTSRLKIHLLLFSSCCCFEFNQFRHFISSTLFSVGPTSINPEWNMQSGANICTLRTSWKFRHYLLLHPFP